MIQPIPWYDCYIVDTKSVHLLNELFIILMFLRFYFILRTCFYNCQYADAFSIKISKAYGFESVDISYNLKCLYATEPLITLGSIFVITIFIFSYIIRIAEMPFSRMGDDGIFDSSFNSVYFTAITLTTIGYGDISPGTKLGKALTICFALWGTVLLAVVVAATM